MLFRSDFMREAHEGYPYKGFSEPNTGIVKATVCSVSGLLLTDACGKNATTQYFLEGTQPTTMCDYHKNRESARDFGALRLLDAKMQSGAQETAIEDKKGLVLDLSFLNISTSEDFDAYQEKTNVQGSNNASIDDLFFIFDNDGLEKSLFDDKEDAYNEDDEISNFLLD